MEEGGEGVKRAAAGAVAFLLPSVVAFLLPSVAATAEGRGWERGVLPCRTACVLPAFISSSLPLPLPSVGGGGLTRLNGTLRTTDIGYAATLQDCSYLRNTLCYISRGHIWRHGTKGQASGGSCGPRSSSLCIGTPPQSTL